MCGVCVFQEDLFKKEYGADAKGKGGQKFKSTFFMMVAERGINALVRVCMCVHAYCIRVQKYLRIHTHIKGVLHS